MNDQNIPVHQMLNNQLLFKEYCRNSGSSLKIPNVMELPPQSPADAGKLTVVLDLDETLIHTELVGLFQPVVEDVNETFFLDLPGGLKLRVTKRPFLDEFLREASKWFELIVFTAGAEDYATPLLDHLDPDGTIFRHRLFRQHCFYKYGPSFVKDLWLVNRCLRRTVIVDNNTHSFMLQLSNGIPIESFFRDPSDCALHPLFQFLVSIMHEEDVRDKLEQAFRLESTFGDFVRSQKLERAYNFNDDCRLQTTLGEFVRNQNTQRA